MGSLLYNILLFPLIQLIEFVYLLVLGIFHGNAGASGYAIIGVSISITLLCLPLYVVAEKWQQVERNTQKKLQPGISRIKAVFKGDEQYMILRTFYRQNGYHPMMALRSSFSLLIQIPFFMAAYEFLSNLETLQGVSFLFIKDLGVPDATFCIGRFPINVLPIAMTIINCVAGAIYTKGFEVKDKIQIYGMALLFLVILYNSPAGLVLYWTMNNVFSLIKNIFYKMKKPLLVFYLCVCFGVVSIDWYLLMVHGGFFYKRIALVVILSSVFFIPLLIKFVRFLLNTELCSFVNNTRKSFALFFSSCLVLVLLCGLFIISNSVAASPMEFSFVGSVDSPWTYIIELFQKSLGLCLVWPLCIFLLFGKKIRALFSILFSTIAFCALVNAFLFDGGYGNFSSTFIFDNAAAVNSGFFSGLVNMFVLILVIVLVFILVRVKKTKWLVFVLSCVCLGLLGISLSLFPKISSGYQTYCELRKSDEYAGGKTNPVFQLSKTEKNIFIIDLDRAVNALLPAIFEERPDLKEKFSGFVYYPNTFSFSMNTLAASPAMFGGYDYIPQKIMERSDESLVNKHNEALKAIPVLFDSHGYNVTVSDLSFANYQWIADLSIFDDYSGIKAVTTERVYSDLWLEEHPEIMGKDSVSNLIRINSFWYTLLRVSPVFLRSLIYNSGRYWSTQKAENTFSNLIEQYSVLDYLPELTGFESVGPTYTFMVNDTTHEPAFLEAPDYIPVKTVTDFGSGPYSNDATFHVNIAALLRIGEWIDYLKSAGVYDNTRIIIVSDHGTNITTDQRVVQNDSFEPRVETFNPLLLVKDFGNQFPIQTDVSYMTNADVAALSCSGVIENPVNPFTQNPIDFSGKGNGIYGLVLEKFSPDNQNKNTFKDPQWYKTGNDVFSADAVKGVSAEEAMEAAK